MNKKLHMEWVPEIDYRGYSLTLPALETEETAEKTGKTKTQSFQRLTDLPVAVSNSAEFADAGKSRWFIVGTRGLIYKKTSVMASSMQTAWTAMQCRCLLTQTADILMQLYEKGRPGIRKAKNKIKNISSDLLKSFGELLTGENISFMSAYGYVKAV